tara:strand:+ start:1041 stop:1184 length:144 start_codon:yes stop_codon:yes gene_type:complete
MGDPNADWWEARAWVVNYLSNPAPFRELSIAEANFEALSRKASDRVR